MIRFGVVENRNDPMELGRCQVRIMGMHTADKMALPTDDLPWAHLMQPATSAAMNGIGHAPVGLVPGTWVCVTFADEDCQQPIILGSIGGIPDTNTITSSIEDNVITIRNPDTGVAEQQIVTTDVNGNTTKMSSTPVVEPTASPVFTGGGINKSLPKTSPPQSWIGNRGLASVGIQSIIIASTAAGFGDRNAISAFLGIVGVECGWIPVSENLNYTKASGLTGNWSEFRKNPELCDQYLNDAEKLANFIYAKKNGNGDEASGDGFRFRGRGFVQLTGKAAYTAVGQIISMDLVTDPDIVNSSPDIAAKVLIGFFQWKWGKNVPAQNAANFFTLAANAVNSVWELHRDQKQKYYEYFLGQNIPVNEKSASPADISSVDSGASGTSMMLPGGDRTSNTILGFSDPNGKYPLRSHLHEPDTNRLARGKIEGTCVNTKDSQRTPKITTAFGESFEQPLAPFGAKYPYNKVFESESGHVMEFDDSPGNERVNTFHRSGTFTEIDANGTQVNKIVGDAYTIIDRNGSIYIMGTANVTVNGSINVLCNSNANIEVMGTAKIDLRSDAHIGVNHDANIGIGNNLMLQVNGNVSALIQGDLTSKVIGNTLLDIGGNMSTKIAGDFDLTCNNFNVTTTIATNIKSSGLVNLDGLININTGAAMMANTSDAPTVSVTIPAVGITSGNNMAPLDTPPRVIDLEAEMGAGESPDEMVPSDVAKSDAKIVGDKSTPSNTIASDSTQNSINNVIGVPASCDIIMNTQIFQMGYVLSPTSNITFGTMNNKLPGATQVSGSADGALISLSTQQVACNMKQVAVNILEGVYTAAGGKNKIIVSSSFRRQGETHWKPSSDHSWGRAVDFQIVGQQADFQAHYDLVCKLQTMLPYDQLILEYRDAKSGSGGKRIVWIHCSYRGDQNRKMAFTMLNDATYKRDSNGIPSGFYLL